MRRSLIIAAGALAVLSSSNSGANAQQVQRVQVGVLECRGGASVGFIVGSVTNLGCVLRADGMPEDRYIATIRKVGLDLGITQEFGAGLGRVRTCRAARTGRTIRRLCRRAGQRHARRRRRRQRAGRRIRQLDRAATPERAGPGRHQHCCRIGKPGTAAGAITKVASASLRGTNGSRECAPDDRLRDEAIHAFREWRHGLLRFARNDVIWPVRAHDAASVAG